MLVAMSSSPTPASVHLVLVPEARAAEQASIERVRGWLLLRLIEDGYVVVASDAEAGVRLTVARSDGQWVLRAAGRDARSDVVADSGSGVASLKMIHRALALLSRVEPSEPVTMPQRVVVIRTSRESPDADAAGAALESLVSELERAGVAVAREYPGAKIACLAEDGESVGVGLGENDEQCLERARARATSEPGGLGMQVEYWLKRFDGESTPALAKPKPAANESSLRRAEPVRDAVEPASAERADPLRLWGHVGLGWEHRDGGSDPFVRVQIDGMRDHGLGLRVQGDLLQSGPPALDIMEVEAQGGVTLNVELGGSSAIAVSALAGARFHRYVFGAENADLRMTPIASLPVEFVLRRSSVKLALGGGITAATRQTNHKFGERSVWRRGAVGYGLFLTLGASP